MDQENKFNKFILELTKMTRRGDIIWVSSRPNSSNLAHDLVQDLVYIAKVDSKILRIYKYKMKMYHDEFDYDYGDKIALETINDQGYSEFEFPSDISMFHLYNAIREKTSNINKFLDDFLKGQ